MQVGRFHRIKLIEHVVEITMAMWRGGNRYLVPKNLIRDMMLLFPQFRGYGQQDAHEFLRCLLDQIHEQFSYTITLYETQDESNDNNKENNNGKNKNETKRSM